MKAALLIAYSLWAIVSAGCAKRPIMQIDNPWSGHHIAVTSAGPEYNAFRHKYEYTVRFTIAPPSGTEQAVSTDLVKVWSSFQSQADAGRLTNGLALATNAATEYAKADFKKVNGTWFVDERGGWIPVHWVVAVIRGDFGPIASYRGSRHFGSGWDARVSLEGFSQGRLLPLYAAKNEMAIVVDAGSNSMADFDAWIERGDCTGWPRTRSFPLSYASGPSKRFVIMLDSWGTILDKGFVAVVLTRPHGNLVWCQGITTPNLVAYDIMD